MVMIDSNELTGIFSASRNEMALFSLAVSLTKGCLSSAEMLCISRPRLCSSYSPKEEYIHCGPSLQELQIINFIQKERSLAGRWGSLHH